LKNDRRVTATTGGAIGLSTAASFVGLCCTSPWAVALLGVPGAVAMARLDFLRPYVLTLAAVMLAWAFWRVYRRWRECADGSCERRPSAWLKSTLWLAAGLIVAAFFADELQWLVIDPTPEGFR